MWGTSVEGVWSVTSSWSEASSSWTETSDSSLWNERFLSPFAHIFSVLPSTNWFDVWNKGFLSPFAHIFSVLPSTDWLWEDWIEFLHGTHIFSVLPSTDWSWSENWFWLKNNTVCNSKESKSDQKLHFEFVRLNDSQN